MTQPTKKSWRKLRVRGVPADLEKLLNVLRVLDRTVVEISMSVYNVPRREQAAMLEHHQRLHDMVRERLPQLLCEAGRA